MPLIYKALLAALLTPTTLIVVSLIIVALRIGRAVVIGYPILDYSNDRVIGQGEPYRVLVIGDSTAYGQGASRVEDTYGYRVAARLAESYQVTYRNRAVSGAIVGQVEAQLKGAEDYIPDLILMSVGANDITRLHSPSRIAVDTQRILTQLMSMTTAPIYFANIPAFEGVRLLPPGLKDLAGWQARRTNVKLAALAQDSPKIQLVPINEQTVKLFQNDDTNLYKDGYHPSGKGYGLWAQVFLDQIRR